MKVATDRIDTSLARLGVGGRVSLSRIGLATASWLATCVVTQPSAMAGFAYGHQDIPATGLPRPEEHST